MAPAPYEVVFWLAAASSGIATSLLLGCFATFVAFVRGRIGWVAIPGLAATAFALPCFNEQPAAPLAALPLLAWAALAGRALVRDVVARVVTALAACALGPLTYLYLFLTTATATYRGSAATLTPWSEHPEKLREIAGQAYVALALPGFRDGAWTQALAEAARHPLLAAAILACTALAAVPWLRRLAAPTSWDADARGDARARLATVLFGGAVFLLAWLPVVAVRDQAVASRLTYPALVGLAIAGAALLDAAIARLAARPPMARGARAAVAAGALALASYWTVLQVGVQSWYFHRARLDEREARELVALLPSPAPGTLIVPLRAHSTPTATGRPEFDHGLGGGPFEFAGAAPYFVRWAYRRTDVFAAGQPRWAAPLVTGGDERGARLRDVGQAQGDFTPDAGGGFLVPWERIAPVVVERDGAIRLVTRIDVRTADGNVASFVPPQTSRAARDRGLADLAVAVP